MADIRINALATTASSTASDDFLAVDGSANGTRKLSAYSPTFGGNLTVSGGQALTIGSSANYSLWKDGTPTKGGRVILNNTVTNGLSLGLYDGSSWVDTLHIHPTNNNVLIGTNIDGGQKLQVAGDLALSGTGAGFTINATSGNSLNIIQRSVNTAAGAIQFKTSSTADWIIGVRETSDSDFHLFSYGTVADALTIARSTGDATFAGNTTAKGTTHYFGADNSQRIELTSNNGSSQGLIEFYNRGTSAYFAARYLASSHTFEQGPIAINNTVQTAVAVASTHKVTISIGGSTYYLLATNA